MDNQEHLPTGRRAIRLTGRPSLSVVVASFRETRLLDACLESILPQAGRCDAQVVVARADDAPIDGLRQAYPSVEFVTLPAGTAIPQLRSAGMAAADGDIVALTEDHCVATDDWLEQLAQRHDGGADVVGGSMGNAQKERAIDWAAYFSEYGFFGEGGGGNADAPLLTGANVSYKRSVLPAVVDLAGRGEWENVVHATLARNGSTLAFLKTAAVLQNKNYRFLSFCVDRYEHGRDFARRRLVDEPVLKRWFFLAGSFLLPLVLTTRVAGAAGSVRVLPFIRALPWTFSFLTAWSLGEVVGYLRGPARDTF